jgi:low affinity Fe/Cu permease
VSYASITHKTHTAFSVFSSYFIQNISKTSGQIAVKLPYVLLRVKQQRNILHEISKRKANWIGHILRRNCLLQQVLKER